MDSLCYASEGKELLFSDDIEFPDFNNNLLVPIRDGDGETEFTRSDLPDMTQKSFLDDLSWRVSADDSSNMNVFNPFSRFPSSPIRARDHTLPKIDLTHLSRKKSASSSPESSLTPKKSRNMNLQMQLPVCQVHGCNKDLSLSKDYHKRHRVCDVHSKTAVVIVNGVEQRFCQQCSRFHLLAKFDEGKRSCRERLAGHNKRRRKLQVDTHLGPLFFGEDISRTSLFFSGNFFPQQSISIKRLKYEEELLIHLSHLSTPVKFWQTCAKSLQDPTKNCPYSPLLFQELSRGSNSGYARSLLSDQSHNSLRNPAGALQANCKMGRHSNGVRQEANAETMNLVELSFRLQRVEQERNSALVKQEHDLLCCSTII